jgi:hypothetical protein
LADLFADEAVVLVDDPALATPGLAEPVEQPAINRPTATSPAANRPGRFVLVPLP